MTQADPRDHQVPARGRPRMYIALLLAVLVGSAAYAARWNGIFACEATGYREGTYLSYCQATGYGDYDYGAFWYGLEPGAVEAAARANVLFVGNSRTQLGFSAEETVRWFGERDLSFYLLGFSHDANVVFETALLEQISPQARAYVVNIDRFFRETWSGPVRTMLTDSSGRRRYEVKQKLQGVHRALCRSLPDLCLEGYVIFRSRETGLWQVLGGEVRQMPAAFDGTTPTWDTLTAYIETGRRFVATLPVNPRCIILTQVPFPHTDTSTARILADSLGLDLVAPRPAGLSTFDESHLDQASASRWSAEFLAAAGPRIEACAAGAASSGAGP